MKVTQICIGRFHHFHLARQLESRGKLEAIWTGYPRFKLRREEGISLKKIRTFPWLYTSYLAFGRISNGRPRSLLQDWAWWAHETLDRRVALSIKDAVTLVALSGSGLHAGRKVQRLGGRFICDRGSTHKEVQDATLREEYARWGLTFPGIDPRSIAKELAEYEQADAITVPSEFVRQSFISRGVSGDKVKKIPYGANLARFKKVADPAANTFRLLWVGASTVRKGFLDAVRGFHLFQHPRKEFIVIGSVPEEMRKLLATKSLEGVRFLGHVPNHELPRHFSAAHAFVLTSLEEGLALVQLEALACGCPVIATPNTGCEDILDNGREGFVIPARSPESLAKILEHLASDRALRERMSEAALNRVHEMGGWDTYGQLFVNLIHSLKASI